MFSYIEGKCDLFYNGEKIFSAPAGIYSVLPEPISDCALVTYLPQEFYPKDKDGFNINSPIKDHELLEMLNRNILLIDGAGKIIWRIQTDTNYPECYAYASYVNGEFEAYRGDGFLYDLDIETGKISNPRYVK